MTSLPLIRYLKVYRMTFQVLFSYLWLFTLERFWGKERLRERRQRCHVRNAARIERTILSLKGLFIKVGQTLSIMTNFLPEPYINGLEGLQDAVPPHPYEAIRQRFLQEFQKDPEQLFAAFDPVPIASASLGQVHRGKLPDGTEVAVKVQYPEIDKIVAVDLKAMKRIFWLLHLFLPHYGLRDVYREIAIMVRQELDYQYEGKNLETLKENFTSEERFLFPDIYWDFSSSKVLTLRFMEGSKITDVKTLQSQGVDTRALATQLIEGYCRQIFIDGVYHADPHPGNLMVQVDSGGSFKIILIDFGAIARISDEMREGIHQFAEGLIKKDTRILANSLRRMGFVAREDQEEAFDRLVEYFYSKFANLKIENFRSLNLSNFQNIEDLVELKKLNISFRDLMGSFHVPRDWVLLERTLLLALGITSHLDSTLNPIEIILPYAEKFVLKDKALTDVVSEMIKEVGLSYIKLPHEIQRTLAALNAGTLTIHDAEVRRQTEKMTRLGYQALLGFLGSVGLGMGHWLALTELFELAKYHYYGALVCGAFFVLGLFKKKD